MVIHKIACYGESDKTIVGELPTSVTMSGKTIVVELPTSVTMSGTSLSFSTDWNNVPISNLLALLKCLEILRSLPQDALEEAAEELKEIAAFYSNRIPQAKLPVISPSSIKAKLMPAQVRPSIVLES
jgi:hypothetical protein